MTNANKVKVSKEVAEAIEFLRKDYNYGFAEFMQVRCNGEFHSIRKAFPLNDVPVERLASVLINGYEIEQTPAEKVAEQYRNLSELYEKFGHDSDLASMRGIEFVAKAYGLKIEGVNI